MNAEMKRQGLRQVDLVKRSGVHEKSIQKYTRGEIQSPRGDRTERIARALGVDHVWFMHGEFPPESEKGVSTVTETVDTNIDEGSWGCGVPILLSRSGKTWGEIILKREKIDQAERQPGIMNAPGVFAIYMQDDCMAPRYRQGEIVYVHPGRPPRAGEYVLVSFREYVVAVRRLVSMTEELVVLEMHNPPTSETIQRSDIEAMSHILTPNELAGV